MRDDADRVVSSKCRKEIFAKKILSCKLQVEMKEREQNHYLIV